jgi:tRNA nucleotidyltransferase (CCA-adding enzyme)
MAYNHRQGLMDPYRGSQDLNDKIVRCVGNPGDRFQEDALRMLRAIRFCGQLDFALDVTANQAIMKHARLLEKISQERVREELNKILLTDIPSKPISHLIDTGVMEYIVPELIACVGFEQHNPHHDKDVFHHILEVVDHTEGDLHLRLAALLHDIGKPQTFALDEKGIGHFYGHHLKGMEMAEKILKRLRYDNKTIENVKILVKEHMPRFQHTEPKVIKKLINRVGIENLDRLFKLQVADKMGTRNDYDYSHILRIKEEADRIIHEGQPLSVKDLAVDGKDLIAAGIPQGKGIGQFLNDLLENVLEQPELNNRETLLRLVEEGRWRNE